MEERFERIAKQAIHKHLKTERVELKEGTVYFAYGLNAEGTLVGTWASNIISGPDIARILEFTPDTSLEWVKLALVTDAVGKLT
jgi:hypothetical protein